MSPNATEQLASAQSGPESVLRAIAVSDLVDSTALIEQLGDRKGAAFMQQLDRFARDILQRHRGREIDKTDGFLLLFERPVQAVAFAIEYQRLLRRLGEMEFLPLKARIGIHVGDVMLWENSSDDIARGAKPVEVEGIAKPIAARLMHLAAPGQILLSGVAQSLVSRSQDELETEGELLWKEHGRYRLKGVPEPVTVVEVGERDIAPLITPSRHAKAYRDVPWWRRRTALAVEMAALFAMAASAIYFSLRSPEAIAFGKRDWVVVGDMINQTGEPILNDSLQTAFRIGLEQSRYVNVVSDLKARSVLQLMQRDPETTRIDRSIGSDVALRAGAKALVLPTVTELGGLVRVTLEVVDPRTRGTVYSETSEGSGFVSILPSLDNAERQLRLRLGEAMTAVTADSVPLPQVTTANMDALRAYALALQAYAHANDKDALELYRHATKLDPSFALAYIGIARIYISSDDDATAREFAEKAIQLKDRLPARDQLYLEAWLAQFGPPQPMFDKWRLLGKLYPDYYAAHFNYAYFKWEWENRATDALDALQPALSESDPLRAVAFNMQGALHAADGKYAEAVDDFETAIKLGDPEQGSYYAGTLASARHFGAAEQQLDHASPSGIPTKDIFHDREKIAIAVDQGDWDRAHTIAQASLAEAKKIGAVSVVRYQAINAGLNYFDSADRAARTAAIKELITSARAALVADDAHANYPNVFILLFGAFLASNNGDPELAMTTREVAQPYMTASGYANLRHMLTLVDAALSLENNQPELAVDALQKDIDGSELYLTHAILMESLQRADKNSAALEQGTWLVAHRGRAYIEANIDQILQATNVAESDLALLRMAEMSAASGHVDDARRYLDQFKSAWPDAHRPAFAQRRVDGVSKRLTSPRG